MEFYYREVCIRLVASNDGFWGCETLGYVGRTFKLLLLRIGQLIIYEHLLLCGLGLREEIFS